VELDDTTDSPVLRFDPKTGFFIGLVLLLSHFCAFFFGSAFGCEGSGIPHLEALRTWLRLHLLYGSAARDLSVYLQMAGVPVQLSTFGDTRQALGLLTIGFYAVRGQFRRA
jgi:hypothetical protein